MRIALVIAGWIGILLFNTALAESGRVEPAPTNLVIEANDIYVPEVRLREERHKTLMQLSKDFTFDWAHPDNISDNQKTARDIEAFSKKIEKPGETAELNIEDQAPMGALLYKLATYYLYGTHQPSLAIPKLEMAESLHQSNEAKAWDNNQLAYAYREQYVETRQTADKERALYYTSKVINDIYPNTKNKAVAFAYSVKGLIHDAAENYAQAEANFKTALAMYETIPDGQDDQYTKTKTDLAKMLLRQNYRRNTETITMLHEKQNLNGSP